MMIYDVDIAMQRKTASFFWNTLYKGFQAEIIRVTTYDGNLLEIPAKEDNF